MLPAFERRSENNQIANVRTQQTVWEKTGSRKALEQRACARPRTLHENRLMRNAPIHQTQPQPDALHEAALKRQNERFPALD